MQVIRDFSALPPSALGASLALGNFDGLHIGHRAILEETLKQAKALGAPAAVMTFEPHPREFFAPDAPSLRLMRMAEKIGMLQAMGFDFLFLARFNQALSQTSADDFIKNHLVNNLHVCAVITGENFHFGAKRSGNSASLAGAAVTLGFDYKAVAPVHAGADIVSSSAIRVLLAEGKPEAIPPLLGRAYSITGHVMHGDKRGRQLGFPTANMSLANLFVPRLGVYAVRVTFPPPVGGRLGGGHNDIPSQERPHPNPPPNGEGEYFGVANIGRRPTVGGTRAQLEAHLFDFTGDIYGKKIRVELRSFLRDEKKFDSLDALKSQITRDAEHARTL